MMRKSLDASMPGYRVRRPVIGCFRRIALARRQRGL